MKNIYWVGGSKGGVGKSLLSMSVIDYWLERDEKLLVVDCDTSNPDVWKVYGGATNAECIDLESADGWIHMVNLCDTQRDRVVVINTAARSNQAVTRYGSILSGALEEMKRHLVALWVINRQRDSLELLKEFVEAVPSATVHVVRNGYFGEEKKFDLYNNSKIREAIEKKGGKSVTLPDLADRVADDIYSKRIALAAAAQSLPLGNRAELSRWRSEAKKMLAEVTM